MPSKKDKKLKGETKHSTDETATAANPDTFDPSIDDGSSALDTKGKLSNSEYLQ